MKNVLASCVPRQSIIQGTFNPEVFTAALGPVIDSYKPDKQGSEVIDNIYTNAEDFFREATYVTDGLKSTINNIFKRIAGDMTVPSIQRLETAFGGGKTHTLIACVHIANRGKEIANVVDNIIEKQYLPDAGTVKVVGVAGDEISLSKTVSGKVKAYTLWGEIALQIGGEELYAKVQNECESYAAPGKDYFETVFGDRKLLIMFDELAQYASKLEAYNGTSNQLAAFIMALIGYVRKKTGIAVVITLAGSSDAFAKETEKLGKILNDISVDHKSQDDVLAIAEKATHGLKSVVMRDASPVTPVQANEISAVLAKRLFESIDTENAKEVAEDYRKTYEKNKGMLPQEATSINFIDRIVSHYPFHPTLIDFLNNKLAQAENFQGTRGVLRTLAMAVRSIWKSQKDIMLVHVSDLDMRNSTIVDEILGRTGSSDLKLVLTADIGSVETSSSIKGGKSIAQIEDYNNHHPDKVAMYEDSWKVVFLNSLVGRAEGINSNVFGVSEQEAIFQTATPKLLPSQVRIALEKIKDSAYYLRYEHGKYYAHIEPTINSVLARIRGTIEHSKVVAKLRSVANSLIKDTGTFAVVNNVSQPSDIPDDYEKPVVAVISLEAEKINVQEFYQYKANGNFRIRKNLLTLLIPKTVQVEGLAQVGAEPIPLWKETDARKDSERDKARAEDLAKQVLAINILADNPQSFGINPAKLQDADFRSRQTSRPQELNTAVAGLYANFCYYSVEGIVRRDIKNAGGDSGENVIRLIEKRLLDDNELILLKNEKYGSSLLKSLSNDFIFKSINVISCKDLLQNFFNIGTWPILADKRILERILREGVDGGLWAIYRNWTDPTATRPTEIYHSKKPITMDVDLFNSELKVTTIEFAKKNGWLDDDKPSNEKVKEVIKDILQNSGAVSVIGVVEQVQYVIPKAEKEQVCDNIKDLATNGGYAIYKGSENQTTKPDIDDTFEGFSVPNHELDDNEVVITRKEQAERGWFESRSNEISIQTEDSDKVQAALKLLGNIGSMYRRGKAKCNVDLFEIYGMKLPGGGTMRITLEDAQAIDFQRLEEMLQDLNTKLKVTNDTGVEITIKEPVDKCELAEAIKKFNG